MYLLLYQNQEASDFVDFVTQPKENLPLDTLFQVWRGKSGAKVANNVESVKQTQSKPKSAGVLQGGEPRKPDKQEDYFNRILSFGNTRSIGSNIKK